MELNSEGPGAPGNEGSEKNEKARCGWGHGGPFDFGTGYLSVSPELSWGMVVLLMRERRPDSA